MTTLDTSPARPRHRRELILEAAIDLFRERGFEAASIDDIGAAAGITGPGVYRHFTGKQAILDAAVAWGAEEILVNSERILDQRHSPTETVDLLVAALVDAVLDKPGLVTVMLRERRNLSDDGRRAWDGAVASYQDEWIPVLRELRPGLDDVDARALVWIGLGMVLAAAQYREGPDRERLGELLRTMIAGALLAPEE